jgi:hypothetical protein
LVDDGLVETALGFKRIEPDPGEDSDSGADGRKSSFPLKSDPDCDDMEIKYQLRKRTID